MRIDQYDTNIGTYTSVFWIDPPTYSARTRAEKLTICTQTLNGIKEITGVDTYPSQSFKLLCQPVWLLLGQVL